MSAPARPPSMRWNIALTVAALALLLILAQAAALLFMFEDKEEEFITEILDQQIGHSIDLFRASQQLIKPNTPDMRLFRVAAGEEGAEVPPYLRRLPIGDHEIHDGGREYHVAVRPGAGEDRGARFILAYDVEDHEERLRALTVIILSGALLMAAATLVAVYFISGRLTHRLEQLSNDVASGRRQGGYVRPGMEREIVVLAGALESLEERQRALLEREREFTAHLAHELRTPLTGIRTDAELIAGQSDLPQAVLRRAGRIVAVVDRIADLANSLLALAREAPPGLVEEVGLADALHRVWEPLATAAAAKGLALVVDVPTASRVRCDQALLELVLRNLLDNALRHSGAGDIVCRLDGRVLRVRDNGPGIPADDLLRVFERFYRAGKQAGHGLGLALVRHACVASGWVAGATNADEGGAVFHVDFGDSLETPNAPGAR